MAKNPNDFRALYYIGREYINRKEIIKAVGVFEKYKAGKLNDITEWSNELADVLYLLSLCYADREVWGDVKWFDAVVNALWSHSVLPTSSDTCELLRALFSEMPGSEETALRMQQDTALFWEEAEKKATDKGVLMKRKF